ASRRDRSHHALSRRCLAASRARARAGDLRNSPAAGDVAFRHRGRNPVKEDLLPYYENELSFIRGLGKEFAATYSKIARRLALEPDKCEDPHVERLIESFALLAGRIHHKIDDEFPEVTESLLNVLYPHYLRPIPSMSIAQFKIDPDQAQLSTGHTVE